MKKIYFLILFFSSISNVNSQCNHTIRLTDTFGDGWNGGTVSVSVNGVNVLTNITLGSGFGPMNVTFSAVTGNTIRVYETAAGSFANEMRVQVFDGGMTSIIAQIDPVTGTATTGGTTGIANCPPAMTFSSSTVTQSSIASVVNCSSNAQIIRLEITTAGVTAPLTLTQIQSNFAGTALPANISLAKVFYTGTSATFSTTTLFGSATPTVANYNINGSQVLATGVNHFWLVYDLNNTGVIGNTVDAIIPQFTLAATNRIPTVTSPAGTRAITICLGPGGVTSGLETWLKADLAYASGSPATWANQGQGAATLINGTANPARNTTSTSYNYNPYIEFTGPSGALFNGGADPVRQFVRLAGNDDLVGPNFRSLFFTSNLTDLSRVYTHLGTVNSISGSSPLNGTISGDDNGGNAAVNQAVYDPLDFGNIAGVWQRNATNISSNAVHLTTKNMLSAVTATGNGTIVNRFLGGQNDNSSGSFEGGVRDWRGPVGEVIGFTSQLTAAERRRVHTYLAVKYGITLAGNYLNTAGTNIYTPTAPYNLNIIGIGRDDVEALFQKQSHQDDDTVRIYLNTIAGTNIANGGSFGNDLSYVVQGSDNRRLCTTASAMTEIPASCSSSITSRLEREWKVTRTNMAQNYNMDVRLNACGAPGSVNVADLRFLVDDDGNFGNGGTQCYSDATNPGLFTYSNPTITVNAINSTMIPDNSTRFITIASINTLTPLPIELLFFDAKLNENETVDLSWETASERDNDYFTIDRSVDGINWNYLGTIDGAGTTTIHQSYYLEDINPSLGVNYYRLKQTDFNGDYTYSEIRSVNLINQGEYLIYPNPAEKTVNIYGINTKTDEISILNNLGQQILADKNIISEDRVELNTSMLANGIYYVKISSNQSQQTLKLTVCNK